MKYKAKTKHYQPTSSAIMIGSAGFLIIITLLSAFILASSPIHADTTVTRGSTVSVTVNNACTMMGGTSGTTPGDSTFSASVNPGTVTEISGSKLTTVCNDINGYSIYAIGYSGNSYDTPNNTKLLGINGNIDTSTTTGGSTSSWAMKLAPVTGVTPPTILNSFNAYHVIPDNYVQIAKYTSTTAASTSPGAQVQTMYQVYVTSTQIAGTYTGKVKYTMIHPNNEIAPTKPMTLDAIAADTSHTHYMQDSIDCVNSTVGTKVTLTDSRDNSTYQVAKAADGKCWMLQNLKLGSTLTTAGSVLNLNETSSNINGPYTLSYSDIPTDGVFHAYTIDGIDGQNNSNEFICRSDFDSCYYNWYTATAGAGTTSKSSGSVETSICPAGWSLPTGGGGGQFQALYNQYPSAALMEVDNPTTTKQNTAGKIPGFLLSGFYATGGAGTMGSNGGYWSRTANSSLGAYDLYLYSSSVVPTDIGRKYVGFAVRCVAEN